MQSSYFCDFHDRETHVPRPVSHSMSPDQSHTSLGMRLVRWYQEPLRGEPGNETNAVYCVCV